MIRPHRLLAGAVLGGLAAWTVSHAAPPQSAPAESAPVADAAGPLELLLDPAGSPTRLELTVRLDGKPVRAVWDGLLARYFSELDRNGDGQLDAPEAARIPTPFALRQILWGQFTPFAASPPPIESLDRDKNQRIDLAEFRQFYRESGLGDVVIGVGKPPFTAELTQSLIRNLDRNGDGIVQATELDLAHELVAKLDRNEDELVGPGELVDHAAYPGAQGALLLLPPRAEEPVVPLLQQLPLIRLPVERANRQWIDTVAARRESQASESSQTSDWQQLREKRPLARWEVNFPRFDGTKSAPAMPMNQLSVRSGPLWVTIRAESGKLAAQTDALIARYRTLFQELDLDNNGSLNDQELSVPKAALVQPLLDQVDRNQNRLLDRAELDHWLALQRELSTGGVLLTLLDYGNGLFELLDANRDGSLSHRELREARTRVRDAGALVDGKLDAARLPHHLRGTLSQGHPESPLESAPAVGPTWFRAMDRNRDGEVSRREFTGPRSAFDRLDANRDGVIVLMEAEAPAAAKSPSAP
ncbi:EF-hand domain-containing protein [Tuwongella immobilis]|uniref:EF-hand domain-containing protein n=1 Tax=Tuwongella immobilis TaxID=692036 RepID=A0A6C2YST9_9BACT|nr:EF-hand domain-containing protein [Tuwongella immobilis]VIP04780.1 probable calmodulin : Uncharacterized protein OS=Pirellula staleyi (strain ATCC 27377 / DSM 6068 / ICPB 4128) GN=Psta_0320 PE=4 SV=1: EF-hand_5: EF-hand_8: EF-hand_5: EF-hand_5 [Tuwongella immobilis]VTS06919.1 probable calmodulin : Uncharacterized protein OS=Pirellula staleyi (strain ATCC 27377 / DSM 6068 / ICPB 4128) GN=Psta_0320 PE=4 SV=1: EF-hand_5: EF-hand_8: EF-hand_5: EF-hand_5 [Tuwongella immobilis]